MTRSVDPKVPTNDVAHVSGEISTQTVRAPNPLLMGSPPVTEGTVRAPVPRPPDTLRAPAASTPASQRASAHGEGAKEEAQERRASSSGRRIQTMRFGEEQEAERERKSERERAAASGEIAAEEPPLPEDAGRRPSTLPSGKVPAMGSDRPAVASGEVTVEPESDPHVPISGTFGAVATSGSYAAMTQSGAQPVLTPSGQHRVMPRPGTDPGTLVAETTGPQPLYQAETTGPQPRDSGDTIGVGSGEGRLGSGASRGNTVLWIVAGVLLVLALGSVGFLTLSS